MKTNVDLLHASYIPENICSAVGAANDCGSSFALRIRKVVSRLTKVDLILWGQMLFTVIVWNACSVGGHQVIIHRGDAPLTVIETKEAVRPCQMVVHNGKSYLVVEAHVTTESLNSIFAEVDNNKGE